VSPIDLIVVLVCTVGVLLLAWALAFAATDDVEDSAVIAIRIWLLLAAVVALVAVALACDRQSRSTVYVPVPVPALHAPTAERAP
jgi:hypothetical protein